MLIGIDVGGTHTDAVLLQEKNCIKSIKVPTISMNPTEGIFSALHSILMGVEPTLVQRVCISSTLGLNALLTGNIEKVGVLVFSGPGIPISTFWNNDSCFINIQGSQDHRGKITEWPDKKAVIDAFKHLRQQGIKSLAVISKFSIKNPELEEWAVSLAKTIFFEKIPIIAGNSVSGALNFPRRVYTAFYRAGLLKASSQFMDDLCSLMENLGLNCPLVILKADAGTFSSREAKEDPASSMGSGPAASLLGVLALVGKQEDALMLDIGGTTTDIAFLAKGEPLLVKEGLTIGGNKTLIKGLWTISIPVGGDSALSFDEQGSVLVGPERKGAPLSITLDENKPPTLTDALNILGCCSVGNTNFSYKALDCMARKSLRYNNAESLALASREKAVSMIQSATTSFFSEINSQPVYTIREILHDKPLNPAQVVVIGGPAVALANYLQDSFELPVFVPKEAGYANAIGAALARPTKTAELYADSKQRSMHISPLGISKPIDSSYTIEAAKVDIRNALLSDSDFGQDIQFIYAENFYTVENTGKREKIIRVKAQLASGLLL